MEQQLLQWLASRAHRRWYIALWGTPLLLFPVIELVWPEDSTGLLLRTVVGLWMVTGLIGLFLLISHQPADRKAFNLSPALWSAYRILVWTLGIVAVTLPAVDLAIGVYWPKLSLPDLWRAGMVLLSFYWFLAFLPASIVAWIEPNVPGSWGAAQGQPAAGGADEPALLIEKGPKGLQGL